MAAVHPTKATLLGHLAAAAVAIAAAILLTWPLTLTAANHVLAAIYGWDAFTNAMILGGHVDAALGRAPLSLYDNYFFAPIPESIVFNENLFGLALIYAPLYLVVGNPLWAYNVTLLTSLVLCVFFTYLLVRRLTGSGYAGVVAGIAFAFSPYVLFEIGRIQLVATQWIPACFLLLHQAIDKRRLRDVVGLWACYLLQVGTCLYYAMFLIPLLALAGAVLLVRHRPPRAFYVQLAGAGAVTAAVALAMVRPYFRARESFDLERSISYASSHDGKLSFFGNVSPANLTLTALHHQPPVEKAFEEIAFPGFTVLALILVALGVALVGAVRTAGVSRVGNRVVAWIAIAAVALTATLFAHSMLAGVVVVALGIAHQARSRQPSPFAGVHGLYIAVLLLAVVMFLGMAPLEWRGEPVRGLYYYFHAYFPGFNGIRKVSRQAVMTTFLLAVLSGYGSAWLLSRLKSERDRVLGTAALLAATCLELRAFPHPVHRVWSTTDMPEAYGFLASRPKSDLVVAIPQNDGTRFHGDYGLALHNYLMLHHKHRSLNGQSSWLPPVTDLVLRATKGLPGDGARRILQSVGARHILIHGDDLGPRRRNLPERLAAQPEHYQHAFQQGGDHVFTLSTPDDPTLALAETPAVPAGAQLVAREHVRANANLKPQYAHKAVDGNPNTYWSTWKRQATGQRFDLTLDRPRRIVAFEIDNGGHSIELPLSYELSVAEGKSAWRTVAEEPAIRVFRDLVYAPKGFVFRVVLPEPALADQLRIVVRQPVPDRKFTIHEARVYEAP